MSTITSHEESIFPDRRRLFTALCQDFQDRLTEIIRKRRKASLALAGGTTPGPLYESLSNVPVAWEKVTLTVTDERWVSPEDPASNEYLVRDLLMRRRAAGATFVPLKTNHAKASGGAGIAEKRITPIMPFDICLIGMGPDGHIASLIPGADGYAAAADPATTKKLAGIHAPGAAGSPERMTLTIPGLLSSRRIVVLFMGQDKMNVFNEAKAGEGSSPLKELLAQKKVPVHAFWAP
ncbi:MAG: 6-phosphogluconolactonase [Alphaproteobacteria bacterium 32-64-14]|nr:MAG: 6-phosphogluconolactonase [Alphaproteobacteria bacterium 32-64-14]